MIADCKLSNMKTKNLPNCLKGKYGYHLGEFTSTSLFVFWAERAKRIFEYRSAVLVAVHSCIFTALCVCVCLCESINLPVCLSVYYEYVCVCLCYMFPPLQLFNAFEWDTVESYGKLHLYFPYIQEP